MYTTHAIKNKNISFVVHVKPVMAMGHAPAGTRGGKHRNKKRYNRKSKHHRFQE